MKKAVQHTFGFERGYFDMLLSDVPDERMCEQPGGCVNHPAWQIGHLAHTLDGLVALLGGETKFDDSVKEKFGFGSAPTAARGDYPSKDELLAMYDERRGVFTSALEKATDADFEKPHPDEQFRQFFPTVGDAVVFVGIAHEGMHAGQLASWRRAAGMPEALAKLAETAA